jgi:integration host factor subunit alpha
MPGSNIVLMEHVTEMTKADIAKHVQEVAGISEHEAEALLDQILELVKSTLKVGEEVTVTGFGKFRVRTKNARIGRNPRTGEEITIPARRVVTFQASRLLKEYVNTGHGTEPDNGKLK